MIVREEVKGELLRKVAHVLFCFTLLIPYIGIISIPPLIYYTILAILAALINGIIVKKPLLSKELVNFFENRRKKTIETILYTTPQPFKHVIEESLFRLEQLVQEQIKRMEREYEKKGGYIGIVHGIIGVLTSAILFNDYTIYGIIALTVIDPIAATIGILYGRIRLPLAQGSLEGTLAAIIGLTFILTILDVNPEVAILISFFASLTELFSIEDNLTIPLVASLSAYLLSAPRL